MRFGGGGVAAMVVVEPAMALFAITCRCCRVVLRQLEQGRDGLCCFSARQHRDC